MGHKTHSLKFASLAALLLLVSACASPSTETTTTGTGSGEVVPGSMEDLVVNVGDRVLFDYNQYNLRANSQAILEKQAAWLQTYSSVNVTIEGHCDERGTREYNLALGERRAAAARDYLLAQGIDPARIRVISYGKERPVAAGSNETSWSKNRRAATVLN